MFVCGALLLGGCITLEDPEAVQEYRAHNVALITPEQTAGQTLRARRPGFNAVQLWLALEQGEAGVDTGEGAAPQGPGEVVLEIYDSAYLETPGEHAPLAAVTFTPEQLASQPVTARFEPLPGPQDRPLYLHLRSTGPRVQLAGRLEDAYPYGELRVQGAAFPADAAFRLSYEYDLAALGADAQRWLSLLSLGVPLLITLWLPGWLALELAGLGRYFGAGERFGLAAGLSLALIAVLMAWSTVLGLPWNAIGVRVAAALGLTVFFWRTGRRIWAQRPWNRLRWPDGYGLALGAVFLFVLAVRLIMVRDLFAPPWVDPVHHGMITRLILQTGGYPASYEPFVSIDTSNYHAGFHAALAVFIWLSGLDIGWAMLIFGQVLNALVAVPGVYLLTVTLTGRRSAGLFAAFIAGLLTPMPAYYTSWGRYTQLAGLLILPAALALFLEAAGAGVLPRPQAPNRRELSFLIVLAGAALGGLFLTHYRVIVFLALLLLSVLLFRSGLYLRRQARPAAETGRMALAVLAGAVFTLPWWPAALRSLFIPKLSWSAIPAPLFGDFSWSYLNPALGILAMGLAGLGLLWATLQRQKFAFVLMLWVVLMFAAANLNAYGLPGGGLINNTSVTISLFLPIAALGGYPLGWMVDELGGVLGPRGRVVFAGLAAALTLAAGIYAARFLIPILNPATILFRAADRPALNWIAGNLPAEATVAVNPFAWGYDIFAGQDGGYWIVPLAGRATMPPPVLYGWDNDPEPILQIVDVSRQVLDHADDPVALHALLSENGIGYVYAGARGGALSPQALQESPFFTTLYAQNGTWVFEVNEVLP